MLELSKNLWDELVVPGRRACIVGYFGFHTGWRVYGMGTYPIDALVDTVTYTKIIDRGALIQSVGDMEEGELRPDLSLAGRIGGSQAASIPVVLDNTDGRFSKLVALENPNNSNVILTLGTPNIGYADFMTLVTGLVVEWQVTREEFSLEVEIQ